MEDNKIIELYFNRSEDAVYESDKKYGGYCHTIAYNILENMEDSEECVNDTWVRSWNSMPPQIPKSLSAFFAKITRNLAINRFYKKRAAKRGGGRTEKIMEELSECIASSSDTEAEFSKKELSKDINRFLKGLPERDCDIFMNRYFFAETTDSIASRFNMKKSNVLLVLSRTRKKLREFLIKEGYII